MSELVTVRFAEVEYYDICFDVDALRLMAITNVGTWHATIELGTPGQARSASSVRAAREAFKTYCLSAMSAGLQPHEVTL